MEDRHLSLSEVAGSMGVSERTVRRWIKAGRLKAYKPGRDYRIPESALQKFMEESEIFPKAPAPQQLESEERRGALWMFDVLASLLGTWERQVREKENPYQSRTIAIAALDIQDAVTFNYKAEWDALPHEERAARHALAQWLDTLAMDGLNHYKQAKKAEAEEVEAIQRRREEIRRRTREIA